jgi:hypothetical protein
MSGCRGRCSWPARRAQPAGRTSPGPADPLAVPRPDPTDRRAVPAGQPGAAIKAANSAGGRLPLRRELTPANAAAAHGIGTGSPGGPARRARRLTQHRPLPRPHDPAQERPPRPADRTSVGAEPRCLCARFREVFARIQAHRGVGAPCCATRSRSRQGDPSSLRCCHERATSRWRHSRPNPDGGDSAMDLMVTRFVTMDGVMQR